MSKSVNHFAFYCKSNFKNIIKRNGFSLSFFFIVVRARAHNSTHIHTDGVHVEHIELMKPGNRANNKGRQSKSHLILGFNSQFVYANLISIPFSRRRTHKKRWFSCTRKAPGKIISHFLFKIIGDFVWIVPNWDALKAAMPRTQSVLFCFSSHNLYLKWVIRPRSSLFSFV